MLQSQQCLVRAIKKLKRKSLQKVANAKNCDKFQLKLPIINYSYMVHRFSQRKMNFFLHEQSFMTSHPPASPKKSIHKYYA